MIYLQPTLAEIDSSLLLVGLCVVVGVLGMVGLAVILNFLRGLRSSLADELKRELQAGAEPSPVAVQQPLVVKPHEVQPTAAELQQVRTEFSELREQRRKDVSGLHTKIENGLDAVREGIAGEFAEVRESQAKTREDMASLRTETSNTARQLAILDERVDRKLDEMPQRIAHLLKS